jgi:hypothetical protein
MNWFLTHSLYIENCNFIYLNSKSIILNLNLRFGLLMNEYKFNNY